MNINIYSIGRSGSKIVQLYTSLLCIKKYDRCCINYEPFLWKTRECKRYSIEGVYENERLPLFLNELNNKYYSNYLKNLIDVKSGIPIVSKFIRGNGRINFINNMMNINKTIFIIRPIIEVLKSLSCTGFDLLGDGTIQRNDWSKLENEVLKMENPLYIEWLKRADTNLKKNACYWAVMNHFALDNFSADDSVLIMDFQEIRKNANKEFEKIAEFLNISPLNIDFSKVSGEDIHREKIIKTINYENVNHLKRKHMQIVTFGNNENSNINRKYLKFKSLVRLNLLRYKLINPSNLICKEIITKQDNFKLSESSHVINSAAASPSGKLFGDELFEEMNAKVYGKLCTMKLK